MDMNITLRTINRIRAIGSIQKAVEQGIIKEGNHGCLRGSTCPHGISRDYSRRWPLARCHHRFPSSTRGYARGSAWRRAWRCSSLPLCTLWPPEICLPASTPTVCVDINPAVPTKLSDRGSFQAVGLVMDSSSFLRELARELGWKG